MPKLDVHAPAFQRTSLLVKTQHCKTLALKQAKHDSHEAACHVCYCLIAPSSVQREGQVNQSSASRDGDPSFTRPYISIITNIHVASEATPGTRSTAEGVYMVV